MHENRDESLEKDGLRFDQSEYRITLNTRIEEKTGTIAHKPYKVKTLVWDSYKVERIKDADGKKLETPETLDFNTGDRVRFENTTRPEEPEKPVDPVDPVDPFEPEFPVEPVEPVKPVDPKKPTEPEKPTQPEKPSNKDQETSENPTEQHRESSKNSVKTVAVSTKRQKTKVSSIASASATKKSPNTGVSLMTKLHENLIALSGLGIAGLWFGRKKKQK